MGCNKNTHCCNRQPCYVGTDLKLLVEITAEGFDMDKDNYTIELRCGRVTKTVPKSEIVVHEEEDDGHYLIVDTREFGAGMLTAVVRAAVPDDDCPDGVRHEVAVVELCRIMP